MSEKTEPVKSPLYTAAEAHRPSLEHTRFHEAIERAKQKAHKRGLSPITMLGALTANVAEGAVVLGIDVEDLVSVLREAYERRVKGRV
jgi:hypothetical protein